MTGLPQRKTDARTKPQPQNGFQNGFAAGIEKPEFVRVCGCSSMVEQKPSKLLAAAVFRHPILKMRPLRADSSRSEPQNVRSHLFTHALAELERVKGDTE